MNSQDRNTILAALRVYQECGYGEPCNRPLGIHEIATDGGDETSLNDDGIDDLCGRLNVVECQHWVARVRDSTDDYREVQCKYFDGNECEAREYFMTRCQDTLRYATSPADRERYLIVMAANPVIIQDLRK